MAIYKPSSAWWISLVATTAVVVLSPSQSHAQTSRDPLELEPVPLEGIEGRNRPERRAPDQMVRIAPVVGVRTLVTDNAYLTRSNKVTDIVVNPFVGLNGSYVGPRSAIDVDVTAGYDSYSRAHQFNGMTFSGFATGQYDVVPQFLTVEALGSAENGNISISDLPAMDRSGVDGRTQVINLAAGPRITATVGDLFDLQAVARVRWTSYNSADGSATVASLPEDSTVREVNIGATTGDRYARNEVRFSGIYQADDNDFRRYTALASVFIPVTSDLRVLARGGADDIKQTGVVDIRSPIWTVGLEYNLSESSYIRVEGGRRYHDNNFAAESLINVTDRFYLYGSYVERILPAQIALQDSFLSFISNSATFPAPLISGDFRIVGPLVNEVSKDKVAGINAVYTWPEQSVGVSASWTRRHLLSSATSEEFFDTRLYYSYRMRPDLRGELSLNYGKELNNEIFGKTESFGGRATVIFDLNPSVQITGGYAYANGRQSSIGDSRAIENILFATMTKKF